ARLPAREHFRNVSRSRVANSCSQARLTGLCVMIKEKRIALVTGANKGIGFEVARQLARKGFRVFLGARNREAGRAAAEKIRQEGEKERNNQGHHVGTVLQIDVADAESVERAAEEFSRQADYLDVLVNNAGI